MEFKRLIFRSLVANCELHFDLILMVGANRHVVLLMDSVAKAIQLGILTDGQLRLCDCDHRSRMLFSDKQRGAIVR